MKAGDDETADQPTSEALPIEPIVKQQTSEPSRAETTEPSKGDSTRKEETQQLAPIAVETATKRKGLKFSLKKDKMAKVVKESGVAAVCGGLKQESEIKEKPKDASQSTGSGMDQENPTRLANNSKELEQVPKID